MKRTSLKSDRVAELLEHLTAITGESKVAAVAAALELRLQALTNDSAQDPLQWLEQRVWRELPEGSRGQAPSKQEQEELLGF